MGFGFRKSFKVAPGVRINVSKRGIGASVGTKGLRYSVNSSGQRRTTASIPGTGLSYTTTSRGSKRTYNSTSYQRQKELNKIQKEREKLQELEQNRLEVDLFENKLEMIHSIHKECSESIDWFSESKALPPYKASSAGPNEIAAISTLEKYKPSFFDKLLKRHEAKVDELKAKVYEAKIQDEELYSDWESDVQLAKRIVKQDTDAYLKAIDVYYPLDDLNGFGSGFEFFIENPNSMEVEFDVHTEDVVPEFTKSLTKTGKVSTKAMTKTMYYDIQQDYVCSCVIRIAREMFALLPINEIIIHCLDEQLNSATGYKEKVVILSVKIDRVTLNSLNFESIDCSDAMTNFEHNMMFRKTKGFWAVDRVE
ncbi:DUF4236 domain-containing protein [Bacillus sp. AGMB 02131]|uniref:DUF4236 domain-containing protein n=2 Tax=Peribacillus faecalis TaxID=2772559 RepID=A0A927CYR6_9BACI|nr:DUF4236 domain-containing protein [Peribacillus faecalis]